MIQDSSLQKNYHTRFPYLLHMQTQQKSHKKTDSSPEFNFNICAQNPCKNQTSQLQLTSTDSMQQHLRKRKPIKIQLQSVNFELFKRKVQQSSFPHSFIAYTPSKQSQDQHFIISNQTSTIQDPKTKNSQINIDESPFDLSKQVQCFDIGVQSQEFIRLQISESEGSSQQQSRIQTEANISSNATKLQFPTLDSTMKSFTSDNKVIKKISQQTMVTLKTKEMSSRLSQNNQFKFYHSVSCTPNNSQKLTQETTPARSTIKLKGRTTKKN